MVDILGPPVNPAVFLDRDNTLIANDGDLGNPADLLLLDGVPEAILRLRNAGFKIVVVTNQGGVARGQFTEDDVQLLHTELARLIDAHAKNRGLIDRFYYCPFHPQGQLLEYRREHPWRKPQPGMLLQAAEDLDLELSKSWMIGDQDRDIESGKAAGCRTVLINPNSDASEKGEADHLADDLRGAAQIILAATQP